MIPVNLFRIVVASPSDVQEEREAVETIVAKVNHDLALDRGIVMWVSRWETDTYPGFHPEGPQALIDTILRIEECDLLVGIFWKRLGKKTKDGTTGTEHEFLTALKAWQEERQPRRPQIMMYFNQKGFFPANQGEITQLRELQAFRERFPEQGLWRQYTGEANFKDMFRDHLSNFIRSSFPIVRLDDGRPR